MAGSVLVAVDGAPAAFTLDDATAGRIAAWLDANAAETADTLPANRLVRPDPAHPLAITATPFWTRVHSDIPDAVFSARAVGGRSQCSSCHADAAAGLFHPAAIAIPKEARQ